jgi:hypothetical protein
MRCLVVERLARVRRKEHEAHLRVQNGATAEDEARCSENMGVLVEMQERDIRRGGPGDPAADA